VLALVSGYESLIDWCEAMARQTPDLVEAGELGRGGGVRWSRTPPLDPHEVTEYLKAERARLARFRQDMGFLERRRA
jgi:hypothetical protein